MNKNLKGSLALVFAMSFASSANAGVVYQYVTSGTYGQASGYSANGFAGVNVSVNGTNTATLVTYSYTATDGYKLWYGQIPASNVTVRGVTSIAVQVDTCSVDPTLGCGYVDVSFAMDPTGFGFITDGSLHYTWDNIIVQVAGPTQVRSANATGLVNGVSVDGTRAFIGKYTSTSIEIQTGN